MFHPKLNLFVREDGGQVQCGSNNLTRSGCTSNLELLNSFTVTLDQSGEEVVRLAQEAYAFFRRACEDADPETGRIARRWLDDAGREIPWLSSVLPPSESRSVRLVDTYSGSLWDRISSVLGEAGPKRLLVISPFFDQDAELAHRFRQRWPKCQIEIVVQQKTTNLPLVPLKKLGTGIALSELRNSSRRLHAKLLAWESDTGTGCLVGSANFTLAAFDARNVEACLLVSDAKEVVAGLFDGQLAKRPLKFDDFDPGTEQEPEADSSGPALRLESALLTETGEFRVSYRHRLATKPSGLRLAIRTPGEQRPRAFFNVPNKENGTATVNPPDAVLRDAHGTILASLVAEIGDERVESPPLWVIQEGRLTYEPSGEGSSSAKSKVEESGVGLTEFLEELGKRDGAVAVIEYLRHLTIRFNEGDGGLHGGRAFRLRIRDPFNADVAPDWLLTASDTATNLAAAVVDFVDRHEKLRLRRHAKRGNINGMENFLDIFTALVRLLYVYHVRGVVHRVVHRTLFVAKVIGYVKIAAYGWETDNDYCEGYLNSVHDTLGDADYLQEICTELNFLGHVRAAFVIVQRLRFVPKRTLSLGTGPETPKRVPTRSPEAASGTLQRAQPRRTIESRHHEGDERVQNVLPGRTRPDGERDCDLSRYNRVLTATPPSFTPGTTKCFSPTPARWHTRSRAGARTEGRRLIMEVQQPARPEEPQFLTVKQAARYLNVSSSCVSRLCRTVRLSHFRFGTGRGVVRIALCDLLEFVQDCRVEKRADAGVRKRGKKVAKPVERIYEHLDLLPQHACGAHTKAGTPCKRMTPEERCPQHSA